MCLLSPSPGFQCYTGMFALCGQWKAAQKFVSLAIFFFFFWHSSLLNANIEPEFILCNG